MPTAQDTSIEPFAWPSNGLENISACPACGSVERSVLHEGLVDSVFMCAAGSWTLYRCHGCHSAYLNPRPTLQTIHLAYRAYYTHTSLKRKEAKDLSLFQKILRALSNGYRNHRFGGAQAPSTRLGPALLKLFPGYRRKLDHGLRHLPKLQRGGRLLDVGSGSGDFAELAKKVGWSVAGVDPDPVAVDVARRNGMDIRKGGIESFSDCPATFDAVTMNHVIEHLHDPRKAIAHAFRLLKPGGYFYVETPNIDAPGHRKYGRDWRGLEPPRHITIFSWPALESALLEAGFDRITPIRRPTIFSKMSSQSRAIRLRKDPYKQPVWRFHDRLTAFYIGFAAAKDPRKDEFITLLARKPSAMGT